MPRLTPADQDQRMKGHGPIPCRPLQIHGGNGYATEYQISCVLCDARILDIFEGAAEIQAQVIARRLLSE